MTETRTSVVPPWEVFPVTPPERPMPQPFVYYDRALTVGECEDLVRIGCGRELRSGTVGNGDNNSSRDDPSYRSVRLRTLDRQRDVVSWLYERLREKVVVANDAFWHFDITGLFEPIQFLEYRAEGEVPGHYKWHQDFGGGFSCWRKASVVVNLTDPALYTGCRLRLFNECDYEPQHYGQGDVVIFPSWTPHCVTPIESGVRHALVAWFGGPQFR